MSSETTVSTGFYDVLAWIEENKNRLVIAGLAVLAGIAAFAVYSWRQERMETEANTALLEVRAPAAGVADAQSPAPADYLRVAERYGGTEAAQRALLLAAGAFFTEGKYAEAEQRFQQFLREHGNHPMAATAAYGLAASLESQGKTDEALAAYQNVIASYPKSAVLDEAKLASARIYEAKGQPELALKTLDEITAPTRAGGPHPQALAQKEALLAKHPGLAKTNAPAATAITNAPAVPVPAPAANAPEPAIPAPAPPQ